VAIFASQGDMRGN